MAKLIALYKQPEDAKKFDEHYYGTHTPIVKKVPGLRKTEVTKITGAPGGASKFYLMCEMYFDNREALNASLKTDEMKASSKDLMSFAGDLVTMMIGEEVDA
ncbi:MAG TPA: EthD family reductase [Bacillales bacterium]|nr:EthD family reductase [Bacillales bacterium]HEU5138796.1 EthD family reductase [Bacillales bacterium]